MTLNEYFDKQVLPTNSSLFAPKAPSRDFRVPSPLPISGIWNRDPFISVGSHINNRRQDGHILRHSRAKRLALIVTLELVLVNRSMSVIEGRKSGIGEDCFVGQYFYRSKHSTRSQRSHSALRVRSREPNICTIRLVQGRNGYNKTWVRWRLEPDLSWGA